MPRVRDADTALAGAVSGVAMRIVSTPLDVLKIRFQLQLEPIKKVCDCVLLWKLEVMETLIYTWINSYIKKIIFFSFPWNWQNTSSKYHGILQATNTILHEEGTRALWYVCCIAMFVNSVYWSGDLYVPLLGRGSLLECACMHCMELFR